MNTMHSAPVVNVYSNMNSLMTMMITLVSCEIPTRCERVCLSSISPGDCGGDPPVPHRSVLLCTD